MSQARRTTALALSTLVSAAGLASAATAHADTPTTLYVDNSPGMACNDSNPGTPAQPFCTVAAALASPSLVPGVWIDVEGVHQESVSITRSGTPSMPFAIAGNGTLIGQNGKPALTISGVHDVAVTGLRIGGGQVVVNNSSAVHFNSLIDLSQAPAGNPTGLTVSGSQGVSVTGSTLDGGPGLTVTDSTDTSVTSSTLGAVGNGAAVVVSGAKTSGTSLVGDTIGNAAFGFTAVSLQNGSVGTTMADDFILAGPTGTGVAVTGSTGDTITSDTIEHGGHGIVASGGSTGLTVADDIVYTNRDIHLNVPAASPLVDVDATSTSGTSIHHNIVYAPVVDSDGGGESPNAPDGPRVLAVTDLGGTLVSTDAAYRWAGTTYPDAASLLSHTGQGTADINADPQFELGDAQLRPTSPAIDSADSSAPGWQSSVARFDDPDVPNSGTGPVSYGDRGAREFQGGPTVGVQITTTTRPSIYGGLDDGFQVNLSSSTSHVAPVASYTIGVYGDSSHQQYGSSPTGTIWFDEKSQGGPRLLDLMVMDSANNWDEVIAYVWVGPHLSQTSPPPPPPSAGTGAAVRRIGGTDRYATGRELSQAQWHDGAANAVVLARGDAAPDALAGVPLAARVHGPLLLTDPTALDPATRAEIDRVLGGPHSGKTVYILGGASAVSPAVESGLRKAGYTVVRYAGDNRFATALKIAQSFGPTPHVIVATGRNFPDALAAGPLGAVEGSPIVLSDDNTLDPDTARFIQTHNAIEAVGDQAITAIDALPTAGKTVTRLGGADRYTTGAGVASMVARVSGHVPTSVGVASGMAFPDALTGGAFAANAGIPLLITAPGTLSGPTRSLLAGWAYSLTAVTLFGGEKAITPTVDGEIVTAVHGKAV